MLWFVQQAGLAAWSASGDWATLPRILHRHRLQIRQPVPSAEESYLTSEEPAEKGKKVL